VRPKPLSPAQVVLAARLTPHRDDVLTIESAVVDSSDADRRAIDGSRLATIAWRDGTKLPVPYLAHYSPQNGDVVLLLIKGPQVIILDRIAGTPDDAPVDDPPPDFTI